jgi:hypothetical protein
MAPGAPIFSQINPDPATSDGASVSDRDAFSSFGIQLLDDVTLTSPATARSVTWWGAFGPFNNTPVTPVSFELIFYGDDGGAPDLSNVLSTTTVSVTSLTDTGDDLNAMDVYVFQANLTATALPGGARIWFSVLADTENDEDDSFLWRMSTRPGISAQRRTDEDTATVYAEGVNRAFVLDDETVPAPPVSITSFKSLGGDVFELTLEGANSTTYEFRSSTSLDFTPGTLVENLWQGNPGDPGIIGGASDEVVTTDTAGDAKIRMAIQGPSNFVRAESKE